MQEEIPSRLPVAKSTVMGSRVGKMGLSKSHIESDVYELKSPASNYQPALNSMALDLSDIRMTIDEPFQSGSRKKVKKSTVMREGN